ncbi:FixH family protein [Halobacillus sp. A1]|uniref:FixH family protein n=1 Tax=Halobacillus sp. A1 TaxID=2880262 RepID=UPI0020A62CB4|nr:FixH family protein [Halobacillus sp. A1]MCP3030215.1 FixH family protein [Halobacillus sp. A1]
MKKISLLSLLFFLTFLAACGSSEEENSSNEEEMFQPEVEVNFEEEPLSVNEQASIQAIVTSNGEPVNDADYVEFEIWSDEEGEDESETIEAERVDEGQYETAYTFDTSGTYQVIAHTQARDVHTMPQVEVQVGEASEGESDGEHSHSEDTEHDHGSGEFTVHLMTAENFTAEESSELMTHIQQNDSPFEKGEVTFEIRSDQLEKHEFVEAEEDEAGEYTADYEFPSEGEYVVNVHYEKPEEEIHGHKEESIEVKE